MKVGDLAENTTLTFTMNVKDQKLEFPSKVVGADPKHHKVYAEAVLVGGKVLGLNIPGVTVSMVATFEDEKPVRFDGIAPVLVSYGDQKCYVITSKEDGTPINRREYYRSFVGTRTEVSVGKGEPIPAVLKDVSKSGFAVLLDQNVLQENMLIFCNLTDRIEMFDEDFTFPMFGIVVRSQELPNGRFVYGCKMNRPVPGIESYIAKKDRERLAKNRTDR